MMVLLILLALLAFWIADVQTARPLTPHYKCGGSSRHRAMFRPVPRNAALRRLANTHAGR